MSEILFISFILLMLIRVPIAIALGMSSVLAIYFGSHIPLMILPQKVFSGLNSFPYLSIPLFLLAGNIMIGTKISEKLIGMAAKLTGKRRGGMAQVTTISSAFFGAISGSSPATTAAIGTVMVPEMKKYGYHKDIAGAVVAASGALGLIIPPSLTMVVYGVISGASIGSLFISGIIPGILICIALIVVNYLISHDTNDIPSDINTSDSNLWHTLLALLMPVIIIAGIYSGAFTATESAGIACGYGLLIGFVFYRNLTLKELYKIFVNTIESTATIMFLMATANIFAFVITAEQIPQKVADLMLSFTDSKLAIMFLIMLVLLIVGTFLDNVSALILLVPTLMTVVTKLDIDPIYFGVFTIIALSVGQFTPPVGLNLLISSSLAHTKIESISKKIIPYILAYVFVLVLMILFPSIIVY